MSNSYPNILASSRKVFRSFWGRDYSNLSYSQEGEDLVLSRFFNGKANGFYVDIGAHHPYRFSNTALFYKAGWRGINVDPLPGTKRKFDHARSRDINLEMGVSLQSGQIPYFSFAEPALNSFDVELSRRRELAGHRLIGVINIETKPLSKILHDYLPSGTAIDFLSVDVEGYDNQVIESNDWAAFRPKMVLVECLGGHDLQALCQTSTAKYLIGLGYLIVAKTYNTVFFELRERT